MDQKYKADTEQEDETRQRSRNAAPREWGGGQSFGAQKI